MTCLPFQILDSKQDKRPQAGFPKEIRSPSRIKENQRVSEASSWRNKPEKVRTEGEKAAELEESRGEQTQVWNSPSDHQHRQTEEDEEETAAVHTEERH